VEVTGGRRSETDADHAAIVVRLKPDATTAGPPRQPDATFDTRWSG
jgi:hypothetical protein